MVRVNYMEGPLTGSLQCRMSNLRNGYVKCHYFPNFHVDNALMSHVEFPKWPVPGACVMSMKCFSHVDRLHVACPGGGGGTDSLKVPTHCQTTACAFWD